MFRQQNGLIHSPQPRELRLRHKKVDQNANKIIIEYEPIKSKKKKRKVLKNSFLAEPAKRKNKKNIKASKKLNKKHRKVRKN